MAAVHPPRHPQHPHSISSSSAGSNHSPFRRVHRASYVPATQGKSSSASTAAAASTSNSSATAHRSHHAHQPAQPPPAPCIDTYYGHEDTSRLCSRFVSHTFNCPETLPPPPSNASTAVSRSSNGAANPQHPPIPNTLAHFVAYALHRTRLHSSVVFTALALLHRLKARFPAARGSSGHRLFLAAYMLASKVVCDDTYSNKSWAVVGQGLFALREINQMEREMLGYLEWGLNVPGEDLVKFEREVRRIYGSINGRDGNGRDGWGRGVEMRLIAGVGGRRPEEDSIEEKSLLVPVTIPSSGANVERSPKLPHQLPTPTDAGPAMVPISRPVLQPISTNVAKPNVYPSPPTSPPPASAALKSAICDSDCSSASTSPVDAHSDRDESDSEDDSYPTFPHSAYPRLTPDHDGRDGSPSPASSEESALTTPPNSALSTSGPHRARRGYPAYGQGMGPKMGKSHTVPGFVHVTRETGRSSAPPVAVPVVKRERDAVSSVSASHFGTFAPVANVEEDGDAVMELEDEKRGGIAYYATSAHAAPVPRPASATVPSRVSANVAVRKDLSVLREREREREIREGRRERDVRNLRTFTVPCAW